MSISTRTDSKDISVIGAGIVGLFIALRLQREGYQVTIIDPNTPMHGCSAGNAGYFSQANIFPPATLDLLRQLPRLLFSKEGPLVIKPGYLGRMVPWSVRAMRILKPERYARVMTALSGLIIRSQDSITQLARTAGAAHLITRNGGLHVYRTEQAFKGKLSALQHWKNHGIDVEVLDGEEVRSLEPVLSRDVHAGLYFPGSGRCSDPKALGLHYFRHLMEHGAKFAQSAFLGRTKRRWNTPGHADRSSIAGNHRGDVSRFCHRQMVTALWLSIRARRRARLPPDVACTRLSVSRPVVFAESYFVATPMDTGLRLAGTAEFYRPDAPPDMRRAYHLKHLANTYMQGLWAEPGQPWMGVRPSLPDSLPAIGEVAGEPGLFYAFGHAHNGLTTSAITAHCIFVLVSGNTPPVDLKPFDYKRFGHPVS